MVKKTVGIVIAALCVALAVAMNVVIGYFSDLIALYFRSSVNTNFDKTPEQALAAARTFTQEEAEDGFVLLKNEDNTLPLKSKGQVNLFGNGSYQTLYQGSGSASSWFKQDQNTNMKDGIEAAGFTVNPGLWKFYEDNLKERHDQEGGKTDMSGADASILEQPLSLYRTYDYQGQNILTYSEAYSETAIVVISRAGGEGADAKLDMTGVYGGDAGKHYLELQQVEIDLLDYVKTNYDTVIVLINASTPMELGFIEDDAIDACLWIGMPGSTGNKAIGRILSGEVTPSGHNADTYAYEVESAPSYFNFGNYVYSNFTDPLVTAGKLNANSARNKYVYYNEGIYVGYRWYETADAEGFFDDVTRGDKTGYEAVVQFPFGFGLSYTTFEWSNPQWNVGKKGGEITVTVDVKNTGKVSGKDVVQLYYHAPYIESEGIEKSEVVLGGFAKTKLLAPQETETVTISMHYDDLASYDYTTEKAYVLSAGTYTLSLRTDSHTVKSDLKHDFTVDSKIVYSESKNGKRSTDVTAATNLYDEVTKGDGSFGKIAPLLTRKDFENTFPTSREQCANATADAATIAIMGNKYAGSTINVATLDQDHPEAKKPTTGAKNGFVISDMIGLDYDDPLWDKLLDQLTVPELRTLFGKCGWHNPAVVSIEKAMAVDMDGAEGLHDLTNDKTSNQYTTTVVLACSWNVDLAEKFGDIYSDECLANGVSALYAPSMNTHRSPFGGRAFEYYSEDGLLAGKLAAAQIAKMWDKGIGVYIKHYMLNDQETNRSNTVHTWATEQTIREIYARPFEISVKEGNATGFMAGYNAIGTTWTGASYATMTALPRGEWGFNGRMLTDACDDYETYSSDAAVCAGIDMWLTAFMATLSDDIINSNYGMQCVRRAAHDQLYVFANSAAVGMDVQWNNGWIAIPVIATILLAAGAVLSIYFLVVKPSKKNKDKEDK